MLLFLFACDTANKNKLSFNFVSHGLLINSHDSIYSISQNNSTIEFKSQVFAKQLLLHFSWETGKVYNLNLAGKEYSLKAPTQVTPLVFDRIELEDATKLATIGNFPDTDIQIDKTSKYLAIGTYYGKLRLYSLHKKKVLWEKKLSEGMAKRVAFSPDGESLYVGEQSVDGFLYAFDTKSGNEKWKYRLADDIESSTPPRSDDMYGIYSLPAVFRIQVISENNILVAGLHSWHNGEAYQKKSKLYSFNAEGAINWTFPKEPLRANIQHFGATDKYLAFSVAKIQDGFLESSKLKSNSVILLNSKSGELLDQQKLEPLKPYFKNVSFWQSISIDPHNSFIIMGAYDGRGFHFPIKKGQLAPPIINNFGTPFFADSVPIMAGISYTASLSGIGIYSVNQSSVPYSYSKENNISSAPMLHPASGSLFAVDANGKVIWKHQDGLVYSAVEHSSDENWLLATIDDKKENREKNLFGFTLFKKSEMPNQLFEKVYTHNSMIPAFFRGAISSDGLFKVIVTSPYVKKKGEAPIGKYQIEIVL